MNMNEYNLYAILKYVYYLYRTTQNSISLGLFNYRFPQPVAPAEKEKLDDLHKMSLKRKAQLHEIEQSLPAKSGRYLQVKGGGVKLHLTQLFFLLRWRAVN